MLRPGGGLWWAPEEGCSDDMWREEFMPPDGAVDCGSPRAYQGCIGTEKFDPSPLYYHAPKQYHPSGMY